MSIKNLLLTLAVAVALVTACGDGDETEIAAEQSDPEAPAEESDTPGGGFPVTIESAAGSFTLDARPERIVSLSPTATELLFAIGAGEQVVAVDEFSTYPPEAPVTDLSGFDPNIEAVLAFDPDLVVVVYDANDLVAGLTAAGVPVLFSPAPVDIDSGYDIIGELGVAVGRIDETAEVIATLRDEMAQALAAAPEADVRIYHELDDTYFSASSFGFIGSIYAELGATNIADAGDPDGTGFPQLTEEAIVEADPEIIVITDEVGYTADDVAARPGWGEITAVVEGAIVMVEADIASRWGPRLPQFVTVVAEAMAAAAAVPAG